MSRPRYKRDSPSDSASIWRAQLCLHAGFRPSASWMSKKYVPCRGRITSLCQGCPVRFSIVNEQIGLTSSDTRPQTAWSAVPTSQAWLALCKTCTTLHNGLHRYQLSFPARNVAFLHIRGRICSDSRARLSYLEVLSISFGKKYKRSVYRYIPLLSNVCVVSSISVTLLSCDASRIANPEPWMIHWSSSRSRRFLALRVIPSRRSNQMSIALIKYKRNVVSKQEVRNKRMRCCMYPSSQSICPHFRRVRHSLSEMKEMTERKMSKCCTGF